MDDENPYAEGLSYAEDVPYEAQVGNDALESEKDHDHTSLMNRIGKRIYLIDDALLKRKKTVEDEVVDEEEWDNSDSSIRPNGLLLKGPPITQLPTARVFAYAVHFGAHPIGLEWVDDETCVLVFNSNKAASNAWDALRKPDQKANAEENEAATMDTDEPELHRAHLLPVGLYPIEERINTALGTQKTEALKQSIKIRWARTTDVKIRGSKKQSEFYKRFGESSGKPFTGTSSVDDSFDTYRRRREEVKERKRQLDAELDEIQTNEHEMLSTRQRGRQPSRRSRSFTQTADEKRHLLDMQLDAFLAEDNVEEVVEIQGPRRSSRSSSPHRNAAPSLIERTRRRSRSPTSDNRTKKRKGHPKELSTTIYQTDEDGRWLHNAEVKARKRSITSFDSSQFGMRAWTDELPRRAPGRKAHKTQNELDKELEDYTLAG